MFYDGNANLKQFFNRRLTKKRKREGGGEEGVEREKRETERERERGADTSRCFNEKNTCNRRAILFTIVKRNLEECK